MIPQVNQGLLAEILGFTVRHVRNLEAEGMPGAKKVGRQKLYDLRLVIPWVREWDRRNVIESRGGFGGAW